MRWDALGDSHAVTETTFNGVQPRERDSHGQIEAIWEEPGFCPSQDLGFDRNLNRQYGSPIRTRFEVAHNQILDYG